MAAGRCWQGALSGSKPATDAVNMICLSVCRRVGLEPGWPKQRSACEFFRAPSKIHVAHLKHGFSFPTKIEGNHHLQGTVQVYNVRIPVFVVSMGFEISVQPLADPGLSGNRFEYSTWLRTTAWHWRAFACIGARANVSAWHSLSFGPKVARQF